MAWRGKFLSVVCGLLAGSIPATALAQTVGGKPKLDDVFKSIQAGSQGDGPEIAWGPVLLAILAIGLMTFAVKHWNQRRVKPVKIAGVKALNNHKKLIRDAARSTGISRRHLKQIAPLAHAQGLSSPLVALICPSAIKNLATSVRTAEQQAALRSIANTMILEETGVN